MGIGIDATMNVAAATFGEHQPGSLQFLDVMGQGRWCDVHCPADLADTATVYGLCSVLTGIDDLYQQLQSIGVRQGLKGQAQCVQVFILIIRHVSKYRQEPVQGQV